MSDILLFNLQRLKSVVIKRLSFFFFLKSLHFVHSTIKHKDNKLVNICKFHYCHYDTVWPRAVSLLSSETEKLSLSSCFCCQHCSPTLKPQEECTWGLSLGVLGNESAEKGAARAGAEINRFLSQDALDSRTMSGKAAGISL